MFGTRRPTATADSVLRGFGAEKVQLPKADADETFLIDDQKPDELALSTLMAIKYRDAANNLSIRRITVRRLHPDNGDLLVDAYCHERRAPRRFRASRILACFDPATGEVHGDPIQHLRQNVAFDSDWRDDLARETAQAVRDSRAELAALVYLARCDGDYDEREAAAIVDFVEKRARPRRINRVTVLRHLKRLFPDPESCRDGLAVIARESATRAKPFVDAVARVIMADRQVAPAELGFFEDLRATFAEHGIEA